MKKLTVKQIKSITENCGKTTCEWCPGLELKNHKKYNGEKRDVPWIDKNKNCFTWCLFFEKYIADFGEGDILYQTVKRLPECIAACKRKGEIK